MRRSGGCRIQNMRMEEVLVVDMVVIQVVEVVVEEMVDSFDILPIT